MLTDGSIHQIYEKKLNRPPPVGKKKKVIGKFKDELGGMIMTNFFLLELKHIHF